MDDFVTLEMLIDKKLSDEIMKKGLAEVAFRRSDAKFREMVKCRILGTSVTSETLPQKLKSAALNMNSQNVASMDEVRKVLRTLESGTVKLNTTTKNLATQVDGIFQLTKSLKNISYLNTGLSLANTAMDAIGFIIVTEKLNVLNMEFQAFSTQLNGIKNVQKNEKIALCQRLIMQCNAIASKIRDNDEINLDELEKVIMDLRAFISEMIMDLQDEALGIALVLQMIFTLMPAYTSLFNEFLRRYYFLHKNKPINYDMFMSLYNEIDNTNFTNHMEDYYFLEKKLHATDVIDIKNMQTLLSLNGRVQIEDQLTILEGLETKEKVLQFERALDNYATIRITKAIPILARECDIDEFECGKYFGL